MGKKKKKKQRARGKAALIEKSASEEMAASTDETVSKAEAVSTDESQERPAGGAGGGKKKKQKRQQAPTTREHPNWPLTGLAAAGMLLTAYLFITQWLGGSPLYCEAGSTCDIVQKSRWGTLLGLPTAFWGFMTYAVLAYIGLRVRSPQWHWKSAWIVSMVGLGYSLYLNYISIFEIEVMCPYCLSSLAIMALIFIVVVLQRPKGIAGFKYPTWAAETLVITVLIVGGLHLHYSGVFDSAAGPEDPYLMALAEHLTKEEAVFYGAYW